MTPSSSRPIPLTNKERVQRMLPVVHQWSMPIDRDTDKPIEPLKYKGLMADLLRLMTEVCCPERLSFIPTGEELQRRAVQEASRTLALYGRE